ncbi:hypothetical protein [Bradyrhizobium cajani]|uniref:Uncharacterized protein n=1 Tax=Bradyrhizobium cajani TaxID=1928661 RepID=A0A844T2I0_9BRAD|nr:hypothetical protein [Bradyrhizobium cajani]MCP3374816.1 hypothetical protein [Bradyrhizobium cajani]MVT73343.1 hypothetical protein [Bradyrhizobium cajani]
MAIITWAGATSNDWTTAANWSPPTVPQSSDTALIPPGTSRAPTISALGVSCAMILGKAESGSVTLNVAAAFGATPMMICGKGGTSALDVTLSIQQVCTFSGQIRITAPGSTVTMTAAPDTAFTFAEEAFVLVAPGSTLDLAAGCFNTAGLFEIAGAVSIASDVTVQGNGLLAIENGGQLAISGIVQQGQQIAFADGTGCITLNNPAAFQGTIGFAAVTDVVGGLISLPGLSAQSITLTPQAGSETVFVMTIFGTGGATTLHVNLLDEQELTAMQNPGWTADDFAVINTPGSGTIVTYVPQGTLSLQQSLPIALVAPAGTPVPLSTIFQNAFGTQEPGFYSITLQTRTMPPNTPTDQKYWCSPNVAPVWLDIDGMAITKKTIDVSDISAYSLRTGNNILFPAQFMAQITPPGSPAAATVTYSIWAADPSVVQGTPGTPQPGDVVLAAQAMNATYPGVPNTNLCNWIADCVAAAAGVPMPLPNTLYTPRNNVDGGFWRIAYRGDGKTPYADWGVELLAGDIVRLEWQNQKYGSSGPVVGHTTTILLPPIPPIPPIPFGLKMLVYDNAAEGPVSGDSVIGIHTDAYWLASNPASITIYRLDPKGQYLIYGSPLGEIIQGSIFNNLIIPGGGADIITAGPGKNEIQGTKTQLAAITVTDFHAGDVFNFTDLDPNTAKVGFNAGVLAVLDNGTQVAAIALPGLAAGTSFAVSSNGNQPPNPVGTMISIYPAS